MPSRPPMLQGLRRARGPCHTAAMAAAHVLVLLLLAAQAPSSTQVQDATPAPTDGQDTLDTPGTVDPADDPAPGTTVLTDDPSNQELLSIQSVLGFTAVVALAAGLLGCVAGLWLVSNTAPASYWDGKLLEPPLRIFFKPQATSASALGPLLLGLLLPLGPMTLGTLAMLGAALLDGLSTLDSRGRTYRRVVVRMLAAVALGGGAILPLGYLLGALVVLPPLVVAAAVKQFFPVVAVSDVTRTALPYLHLTTLGLLVGGILVAIPALAVAALAGLGALLWT